MGKYKRYKGICKNCGRYYEGDGESYCSSRCYYLSDHFKNKVRRVGFKKGHKSGFYGKKHSAEAKKIISLKLKKRKVTWINKVADTRRKNHTPSWNKGLTKYDSDIIMRSSLRMKKINTSIWNNPSLRAIRLANIILGHHKRPTSYENKISELCIKNNIPFAYTGNGSFLIGNKNPDFVYARKKLVIEVYHEYFKLRDYGSCDKYEQDRRTYFEKYGYKTIFIRTAEIESKNWESICLNKIREGLN